MEVSSIERCVALLRARVPLRVPLRAPPYTDPTQSTVHALGWDTFERRDDWKSFEPGHGYYGGTECTRLTLDGLRRELAAMPERDVTPFVQENNQQPSVALATVLPQVLAGEAVLRGWYDRDAQCASMVVGSEQELFWLQSRGEKLSRVERWSAATATVLAELPYLQSNVVLDRALSTARVTEARARLEREKTLLEALRTQPEQCLAYETSRYAKGAHFPWVLFWEERNQAKPFVRGMNEFELHVAIAHTLSEKPEALLVPFDPTLRERVSASEQVLHEQCEKLLQGTLRYQRNSSLNGYQVWIDGVAYEVVGDPSGKSLLEVTPQPHLQPDQTSLARPVQQGGLNPLLQEVTPEWIAAVRAFLQRK